MTKSIFKISIVLPALLLAIAVSCSVDEKNSYPDFGRTVIKASTAATRTALGEKIADKYPVYWQAGDVIDVNGSQSAPLPDNFSPSSSAEFVFDGLSLGNTYHALYPASALVSYSEGAATLELPVRQNYVSGNFDPAAHIMFAVAEKGSGVAFTTPMSFLRLTVLSGSHKTDGIAKVVLRANGGEKMSGTFTTDYLALSETASGKDSLVLDIPDGLALGGDVLIAYPAKTYSSGLSIIITDVDGYSLRLFSNAEHTPLAGKIYKTSVNFGSADEGFTIAPMEEEDLDIEFPAVPAKGPKDGTTWKILFIGNSLTLDGTHFLPQLLNAAGVTNVELTRTFHGGQTIKGYNDNYYNTSHNSICTWKPGQPRWQGEENPDHSPHEAVTRDEYDIVCIQDYPGNSVFWQWDATEQNAVYGLVMKIKSDQQTAPEFVFHMPHSHAYWYENTTVKYFNGSSLEMFRTSAAVARHIIDETPFTRIVSTGAMIQSLRTSAMNQGNDRDMLRGDGVHMDYGFSRYAAGLLFFRELITPITGIQYTDIDWRFEEYCPYHASYATPVTDGNIALAYAAVEAAVANPYDATDLSGISVNTDYSLNPARALEMDDNSSFPGAVEFPVVFKLGNSENTATNIPYWNGYCIWQNRTQPQAYAKWVMASLPRTDVVQCHTFANNTESNISSPSFRGVWTGDYMEFVIPVSNFAAGTKIQFSAPFYGRQSPLFWDFEWLDGGEWKCNRSQHLSYDNAFARDCSFAIGYGTTRIVQVAEFANAIQEGCLHIRVRCADGTVQSATASAAAEKTSPNYVSGDEYTSVFYFYDADDADQAVRFDIIQ